ncbi:MAG: uncharacterized protein JWQ07_4888 [Ramlibacter sp.]|nr:uncharacterized protein [Ramlibacter sp.]
MRYNKIDLNLLAALEVLLAERNVTRAAAALHITQSTMSGTLASLRELFDDELLVRVGRELQLTPLASSLRLPTQDALRRIDALLLTQPHFDPATAARHFVIAASDYVVTAFLTDAVQAIHRQAPGVTFDLLATAEASELDTGKIDFVILPGHMVSQEHPRQVLFDDGYTVVAWIGNEKVGSALTLEAYQSLGHVLFYGGKGVLPWFEQWYSNQYAAARRVEVRAHSFSLLPQLVVGTDRLATVQTRLAQRFVKTLPVRLIALPMAAPRVTISLQWNRLHDADPANRWMRETLLSMAGEAGGS